MNAALVVHVVLTSVITVAGAGGLAVYYTRYRRFRARVQTVPAVITGIREAVMGFGRRPPYLARVGFTTPLGQPVTTEVRLYNAPLGPMIEPFGAYARVGMRVWVDVDMANPRKAEINPDAGRPGARPSARWPQRVTIALACALVVFVVVMAAVAVAVAR